MNRKPLIYLPLLPMVIFVMGCSAIHRMDRAITDSELPTEELLVAIPQSLPIAAGPALAEALIEYGIAAQAGTPMTVFMADSQELLGAIEIPAGSENYRRVQLEERLQKVLERLNPEYAGGPQTVDLPSLPNSVRKYRKRNDLPPVLVIAGSPILTDREGNLSMNEEHRPCDGCVTQAGNTYGDMALFPEGTTVKWLLPRADYGNGPNHREDTEHFLRYVIQVKKGSLVRITPEASLAFQSQESQWDDQVTPRDDCQGLRKLVGDEISPTLHTRRGKEIKTLPSGQKVIHQQPEVSVLKGAKSRLLILPDTSGSMVGTAAGISHPEVFAAMKKDICQQLEDSTCEEFAVCGFGGWVAPKARLSKHPSSVMKGIYWAKNTPENCQRAIAFVKQLKAGGGTPTLAALKQAGNLEGPMTVLMYSDGIPTLGKGGQQAVIDLAKQLRKVGVTISTVGVGTLSISSKDFDWSGADFLGRLATVGGGDYYALD